MPPPSVPSQTPSAQELRETAKQTIHRPEKLEPPRTSGGSAAPSPRHRSPSPSSRPGTRNTSAESRASGGRSRSDRDPDRDDRRDRENRQDPRDTSALNRRDSLTHNRSERSGRERVSTRDSDKELDRDKDRDRGRDRHGDREKERDRDLDRVRDRDRDRDRDRHRRDDKDRDRDGRKERDINRIQPNGIPAASQEDRGLPSRPDPGRHRGVLSGEDGLGKRRRPPDDDVSE